MIHPRVLFLGDPAAATPWVGIAKKLARACYGLKIANKVYHLGSGVTIRVENIFPIAGKLAGISKAWIEVEAGGLYYQFITTKSEIEEDEYATYSAYKGSAVAVKLPKKISKASTESVKGKATGSTLETYGDPPKELRDNINKIEIVKNIAQVQLVPEPVYYGYYLDGGEYKIHSSVSYAHVCPSGKIYNAGLFMFADHFDTTDIGYDLPPTVIKSKNPVSRTPDSDWVNEGCRVRVVSEEYGVRFFIVMADASSKFYCWPDQYDSREYLDPPDYSYTEQQYKANVPAAQVKSLAPPFPDWVYVPVGQRRDTDWPGSKNSGEPRYGWRFHPLGTKVVGTVLKREEWTGSIWATRGDYLGYINRNTILNEYIPAMSADPNDDNPLIIQVHFDVGYGENLHVKMDVGDLVAFSYYVYFSEVYPKVPYEGVFRVSEAIDTVLTYYNKDLEISVSQPMPMLRGFYEGRIYTVDVTDCNFRYLWGMKELEIGDVTIDVSDARDYRYSGDVTTIHNDSPGWCEFSIDIEITGPDREDFSFNMTLLNEEEPSNSGYPIAVDYIRPVINPEFSGYQGISVDPGDLVVAYLECYDDKLSRISASFTGGYTGNLEDYLRKSQIKIRNYTKDNDLLTLLTRSQPTEFKYMRQVAPEIAQLFSETYYPMTTLRGRLSNIDLGSLSFVYHAEINQYSISDKINVTNDNSFSIFHEGDTGIDKPNIRVAPIVTDKQTGIKIYSYGKAVKTYQSGNDLDLWNKIDASLQEIGIDRVQLLKTATRYTHFQSVSSEYTYTHIGMLFSLVQTIAYANNQSSGDRILEEAEIIPFMRSLTIGNIHSMITDMVNQDVYFDPSQYGSSYYIFNIDNWKLNYIWGAWITGLYDNLFRVYFYSYRTLMTNEEWCAYLEENTTDEVFNNFLSLCHHDYDPAFFGEFDEDSEVTGQFSRLVYVAIQYGLYLWDNNIYDFQNRLLATESHQSYLSFIFSCSANAVFKFFQNREEKWITRNINIFSDYRKLRNPNPRIYNYPFGYEILMNEWVSSIVDGPKVYFTNNPDGYYAAYLKYPIQKDQIPDSVLFYNKDYNHQISIYRNIYYYNYNYYSPYASTFVNSLDTPTWCPSAIPSATEAVEFNTIDLLSHPDVPGFSKTHQELYEQAYNKTDGWIDDPEVLLSIKQYLVNAHTTSNIPVFYELDGVSYELPRLNGAALFVEI